MTYHSHPDTARARHQLARHAHYEPAPAITMRPETARFFRGLVDGLRAVADSGVSTRLIPGVARPAAEDSTPA